MVFIIYIKLILTINEKVQNCFYDLNRNLTGTLKINL